MAREPNIDPPKVDIAALGSGQKTLVLVKVKKPITRPSESEFWHRFASNMQDQVGDNCVVILVPCECDVEIVPLSLEEESRVKVQKRLKLAEWNF